MKGAKNQRGAKTQPGATTQRSAKDQPSAMNQPGNHTRRDHQNQGEDSSLPGIRADETSFTGGKRGWPGAAGEDFLAIQAGTGWGQVLLRFAAWCSPQSGWTVLDVGSGPGLLPSLFSRQGCRAYGVDLDPAALWTDRLHSDLVMGSVLYLPFSATLFDLVTASNLLFFLPDPEGALHEMVRVLRPGGQVALINPSEQMSITAAATLADQRGLQGVARASLLNWARRAEAHRRWGESDLQTIFAAAGLRLLDTSLQVGPGLARFALGVAL